MDPNTKTRTFDNIDRSRVDAILQGLTAGGSIVSGSNPWDVDTRHHGVCLRGEWNEGVSELTITITDAAWYVPRDKIWENIDSLMRAARDRG